MCHSSASPVGMSRKNYRVLFCRVLAKSGINKLTLVFPNADLVRDTIMDYI